MDNDNVSNNAFLNDSNNIIKEQKPLFHSVTDLNFDIFRMYNNIVIKRIFSMFCMLILLGIILSILFLLNEREFTVFIIINAVIFLYAFLIYFIFKKSLKLSFNNRIKIYGEKEIIDFYCYNDFIIEETKSDKIYEIAKINYKDFKTIMITNELILFFISNNQSYIMDIRDVKDEQKVSFNSFIKILSNMKNCKFMLKKDKRVK